MTLEQKILARIKTENLRPKTRGWFKARDIAFWALLAVSVVALGVGFGMIIFMVESTDLTLLESLQLTLLQRVFVSVPFFWIAASIGLAILAFFNFRNTKRGYRISARKFIFFAALISVALGSIAYALEFTDYLDEVASEKVPLYNVVVPLNTNSWFDPDKGLLSGTVREKFSEEEFSLRDREYVLWTVYADDARLPEGVSFNPGDRVRIIGEALDADRFRAIEIHPWAD